MGLGSTVEVLGFRGISALGFIGIKGLQVLGFRVWGFREFRFQDFGFRMSFGLGSTVEGSGFQDVVVQALRFLISLHGTRHVWAKGFRYLCHRYLGPTYSQSNHFHNK